MLTQAAERSMSSAAGPSTAQQGTELPAASSPVLPGQSQEAEAASGALADICRAPGLLPTAVQALANAASHGALQRSKLSGTPEFCKEWGASVLRLCWGAAFATPAARAAAGSVCCLRGPAPRILVWL